MNAWPFVNTRRKHARQVSTGSRRQLTNFAPGSIAIAAPTRRQFESALSVKRPRSRRNRAVRARYDSPMRRQSSGAAPNPGIRGPCGAILFEHVAEIRQLARAFDVGVRGENLLGQRRTRSRQAHDEDHFAAELGGDAVAGGREKIFIIESMRALNACEPTARCGA